MNLRQKPRGGKDAASRGGRGSKAAAAANAGADAGNGHRPKQRRGRSASSKSNSNSSKGKRRAADSTAADPVGGRASSGGAILDGTNTNSNTSTNSTNNLAGVEQPHHHHHEQYQYLADLLDDGLIILDDDDLDGLRNLEDDDIDDVTDGAKDDGGGDGDGDGQGLWHHPPPPPPPPQPPSLNGSNGHFGTSTAAQRASPQIGMPTTFMSTSMSMSTSTSTDGGTSAAAQQTRRQLLLNNVKFAHGQARNLMTEHQRAAAAAEGGGQQQQQQQQQQAVPASLEALGGALFAFFTGSDPAATLRRGANGAASGVASGSPAGDAHAHADADAAQPDDDAFSSQQRQRKRTGVVGGGGGGGIVQPDGTPSPSLSSSASPGLSVALTDRLRDAGLPASLCAVITSLLDATDPAASDRYRSSADVEADLGRMVSNPHRYLWDPPLDRHSGTLHFQPNRLYGRARQWDQVKQAFDKIIVTQEETHGYLLISGPPGSGKTALVEKLRDSLTERRGMFVWIKFDSQQQEDPMINICRGLDEYFQRLVRGDLTLSAEIGGALKEVLGSNLVLLKDLMPTLGIVAGGWPELSHDTDRRETYNLILHCLKKLLNVIAHPSHPVIVLFDDLQWSDAASQDIIRMLVTDEASKAAMFIGCYRDNEVDENHPVAENVGAILMSLVPLATITLRNLDKESLNDLCSDVLHLSPRLTRPLAEALHAKTSGNPMFVRQLMRSLTEEGLLQYSASERRWRWDIYAIQTKAIADNAVDLLIGMMSCYGPEIRWLLRVASCLGFRFDLNAITLLASASEGLFLAGSGISSYVEAVVGDGLIMKDGADAYRFSHDQIWLAAYSLIPPSERSGAHLLVGRQFHAKTTSGGCSDSFLFTVADQLNRGIGAVSSHDEELEIAELNLKAGEKALSALLFQPASTYLLQGSALLSESDWNTHYSLCIQLFSACAEVQLAQGRYGLFNQLCYLLLAFSSSHQHHLFLSSHTAMMVQLSL